MDIHKPKPWQGVREFLKEYLIIVVGVLTALAAEQGVEALRERHAAAESRRAIGGEIATDLAFLTEREKTQTCIDRRLDELDGVIARPGPLKGVTWVGRPQVWPIMQAKWQAATSAGRAALLTPDEQGRYGEVYQYLTFAMAEELDEQKAWARLRMLERMPVLTPALGDELRAAVNDARLENWQIKLWTKRSRDLAARLGISRVLAPYPGSPSVCIALDTPRDVAQRESGRHTNIGVGEP